MDLLLFLVVAVLYFGSAIVAGLLLARWAK